MNKKVLCVIIAVLILILLAGLVFIFVMSNSKSVTNEDKNTVEDSPASEMSPEKTEPVPAKDEQVTEEYIPIEEETSFAATNPPATNPPATNPPATESPATEPLATEPLATEPPASGGNGTRLPDDEL